MKHEIKYTGKDHMGRDSYIDKNNFKYCVVDNVLHKCCKKGEPEYPTSIDYVITKIFHRKGNK